MLSLNNIILFTLTAGIVNCTRDTLSVELSYEENILSPKKIADNLSCPREKNEMYSWCESLFSRAHYRYHLKVFNNQLGFKFSSPTCQPEPITFASKTKLFPTDRIEFMLQCVGRHEPLRTDPLIDDFHDKFLIAATPDKKIFYVFIAEKLGQGRVFKLYEEILDMSPILFTTEQEREKNLSREKLLLTIPTANAWQEVLEKIYVNEVIIPEKPIEDELQGIQPNELFMLCALFLTTASYGIESFTVDAVEMHKWNKKPGFINLYFDHVAEKLNGIKQVAYPCYGKHYSGKTTDKEKHVNLYQISSGPRQRSIIVYYHLSNEKDYKIRRLHENVNLTGLLPVGPSPQIEEAGPSEPASKRMRLEPPVPQDISYQLPPQGIAPQHTPIQQPTIPAWEQSYQFQPTDEPTSSRMAELMYPSPTAGQRPATLQFNPNYQIPGQEHQIPIQAAGFPHQTPTQQIGIQAGGFPYQTPSTSKQFIPPQVGSSYHVLNPDQQLETQAYGLPQQTVTTGQLIPPEVQSSYYFPSQHQQPIIQFGEPPVFSSGEQFDAQAGGYPTVFQSTDEAGQQPFDGDYGLDYFTQIPDHQPSADEDVSFSAFLEEFSKDEPGPSNHP